MNQPPRIDPNGLTPPPEDGPVSMSIDCPTYPFYATLSDPDIDDTLYYRVFVDYNRDPDKLFTEVKTLASDHGKTPAKVISFSLDPTDRRFDNGTLTYLKPHAVELFVADRPFFDGPEPQARKTEDEGLVASFVWPVQLTTEPDDSCIEVSP